MKLCSKMAKNAEEKVDLEIIPELFSASQNASGIQGDCTNLKQNARNATWQTGGFLV